MINIKKVSLNNIEEIKKFLLKDNQMDLKIVRNIVDEILENVKINKDKALIELTKKYDNVDLLINQIEVSGDDILKANDEVPERLLTIMKAAAENIEKFHKKQIEKSWSDTSPDGKILGRKITPIETVGVYVPGGTAPLPSSVLMNVIPARVAGVENIYMCTPPDKDGKINPLILAAAGIAGVDRIFSIGGAQGIGAMAFGTETIPKVDKIVGPGNIFVTMAKKLVYGYCDIDMFAGPSDILIIADNEARDSYIAADFLSQAEHDVLAKSIAIVFSDEKAKTVSDEIVKQMKLLSRREITKASVENNGLILVVDNMEMAVELSNHIAPEHLELMVKEPFEILNNIKNAGAIFMGYYSSEPLGDYFAGPNHVLPTNGSSRFFSSLGTEQFIKRSSIIYYNKEAFDNCADEVIDFALAEGLDAHANAIRIRKEE